MNWKTTALPQISPDSPVGVVPIGSNEQRLLNNIRKQEGSNLFNTVLATYWDLCNLYWSKSKGPGIILSHTRSVWDNRNGRAVDWFFVVTIKLKNLLMDNTIKPKQYQKLLLIAEYCKDNAVKRVETYCSALNLEVTMHKVFAFFATEFLMAECHNEQVELTQLHQELTEQTEELWADYKRRFYDLSAKTTMDEKRRIEYYWYCCANLYNS